MGDDSSSPVAPARVRALVLPVGKIKRARFASFVKRLSPENVVRLGDISPDGRPNRNMFSPLGFAEGRIIYDLSTSLPPPSHLALSPFEQYREPLSIIAIADGAELSQDSRRFSNDDGKECNTRLISLQRSIRELDQELESLRDLYSKALVHHLLIFDYNVVSDMKLPEGLFGIPSPALCKTTTIKTIMCDISSMLLAEMTTLARSFQGRHTVDSPNQHRLGTEDNSYYTGDIANRRSSTLGNLEVADTNGTLDKRINRMTMPASITRRASTTSTSRPSTPVRAEDFANQKSPDRPDLDRSTSTNRGRISVQGFGSSVTNDMARNKGKARVAVVIGSLYLQAGRWNDSMRELSEAAAAAKTSGDHLWHAKALDLIIVNMLMLAWAKLDFRIPHICYASAEKTDNKRVSSELPKQLDSVMSLANILPELFTKILHLYERSSNRAGESLPQLAYSQSAIRFSKVLCTLSTSEQKLNGETLELLVMGRSSSNALDKSFAIPPHFTSRAVVTTVLYRAFPSVSSPDELSATDRTIILAGIASVLADIGYHRKKAMVIRDLISAIIPGLIQARIVGAAELGVHPSAGVATFGVVDGNAFSQGALGIGNGNMEAGMDELLRHLGDMYGIVSFAAYGTTVDGTQTTNHDSNEAIISRIMRNARERAFGSRHIKMSVLRTSVDLLEALPDHRAVLRCVSDLLRTAGSGIAPGPKSLDASPTMSREEQLRLITTIYKYVASGLKIGLHDLGAEYWDEFLLRGVELETPSSARTLLPHRANTLGLKDDSEQIAKNPFIHNSFARHDDVASDRLAVAGESAIFKINLQNPYDVDLEIESVRLEHSGMDFESSTQRTIIGPYRTQILSISGMPSTAGELMITGCTIKVRGCRERRFPIFEAPWRPARHIKVKTIGLHAVEDETINRYLPDAPVRVLLPELTPPTFTTLKILVADPQPVVIIKSTSLSQSAIMILEGERQRFTVTLQNLSYSTPVDLLLFSFQDSTQASLRTALVDREASSIELYEYELIHLKKQALRHIDDGSPKFIDPGASATFTFELLGKPGLTNCTIQVDYCNLNKPRSEVQDKFYARQVTLPLSVTVNSSIELLRIDVLPLSNCLPEYFSPNSPVSKFKRVFLNNYFLLILDLRNLWPLPLHVSLNSTHSPIVHEIKESILPGCTSRFLLPIPKIYLENPYKAIPVLDPSRQRQFVVSTQNMLSMESEHASREAFWYREEILQNLSMDWRVEQKGHTERQGVIDLRSMRLNRLMVDVLKVDDVGIEIHLASSSSPSSPPSSSNEHYLRVKDEMVEVDTFQTLLVTLTNRTKRPVSRCIFRLHALPQHQLIPTLASLPVSQVLSPLDLDRKLLFQGDTQFCVDVIEAKDSVVVEVGILVLSRGSFEFMGVLEEIESCNGEGQRGGDDDQVKMLADLVRRRWVSKEAFILNVCDTRG